MKNRRWVIVPALAALLMPAVPAAAQDTTLTIAAVQGGEDAGLKALAPMYEAARSGRQDRDRREPVRRRSTTS